MPNHPLAANETGQNSEKPLGFKVANFAPDMANETCHILLPEWQQGSYCTVFNPLVAQGYPNGIPIDTLKTLAKRRIKLPWRLFGDLVHLEMCPHCVTMVVVESEAAR